jgi:hypothetical protein
MLAAGLWRHEVLAAQQFAPEALIASPTALGEASEKA